MQKYFPSRWIMLRQVVAMEGLQVYVEMKGRLLKNPQSIRITQIGVYKIEYYHRRLSPKTNSCRNCLGSIKLLWHLSDGQCGPRTDWKAYFFSLVSHIIQTLLLIIPYSFSGYLICFQIAIKKDDNSKRKPHLNYRYSQFGINV